MDSQIAPTTNSDALQSLIYEVIDGVPVYYHNYEAVLSGEQTLEGIMGYGDLQWFLVNIIADYFKEVFKDEFWVLAGDGDLHLSNNNNLAADIGFIPRNEPFKVENFSNKYLNKAPKYVIEIDTKADPSIQKEIDYYHRKTQRLLDFGVEQVVWIYTDSKKVTVALPNQAWLTVNWSDEIGLHGHTFSIQSIIESVQ